MDPGLLTLGALTLGATALLGSFRKTQKEGFNVIPSGNYPQTAETAQEIFNLVTLSTDPRQEATRVANLSSTEQQSYKSAVDNALTTIQADTSVPGVVSVTQAENQNPVYVPDQNSIFAKTNFCETKAITADVFSDPKFLKECGVCFTKGVGNDGKEFKGPKGLYIQPSDRKLYTDLQETNNTPFALSKPTLGTCDGATAGVGHDYSFALNKKEFDAFSERFRCKHNRVLDGTCGACLQDGTYTYVGKPGEREIDAVNFLVGGVGRLKVTVGGKEIELSEGRNEINLSPRNLFRFSTSINEGDALLFSINNPRGQAEFYGIMEAPTATGGVNQIPLDKILLNDDVNNAKPRRAKTFEVVNSPNGSITVPKLLSVFRKNNMLLSGTLPFLFVGNAPFEGIDCKASILQSKPSSLQLFGGDPCYKPASQGPGTWSDECLRSRIQDFGCTTDGNLFKNPNELRNMSLVDLQKKVQEYSSKQFTEAEASLKCNGKNITTPCDPFVAYNVNETPDIPLQCLDFLYYNRGADTPSIGPTYTGPVNTFFSLDKDGKRIYCLPTARNDPRVGNNVSRYNTFARNGYKGQLGLKAVQSAMNDAYIRATNTGLSANLPDAQGGRADSIRSCFINLAQVPDTPLPSTALPNARYLRARFPSGRKECIQISQIAVFDNRNINVAQGKPTTAKNQLANDCGPSRAVDGQLASRWHPMEYHSKCLDGDFWQVDFGREYPIKEVVYFNRADCCQFRQSGMLLELLKADGNTVVWSTSLRGSLARERFLTFAKSFNI